MEEMNNLAHKAGVRALGITDKLITGPFWRLIEKKRSILGTDTFLLLEGYHCLMRMMLSFIRIIYGMLCFPHVMMWNLIC